MGLVINPGNQGLRFSIPIGIGCKFLVSESTILIVLSHHLGNINLRRKYRHWDIFQTLLEIDLWTIGIERRFLVLESAILIVLSHILAISTSSLSYWVELAISISEVNIDIGKYFKPY